MNECRTNMLRRVTSRLAVILPFLAVGVSWSADESALAQRSGCLACHRGVEPRIGPPYKAIAEKYAGRKNIESRLAEHILNGTGPTGQGWMAEGKATMPVMPPNGTVSQGNALRLAKWVLGIKGEIADSSRFVTEKISVSGLVQNRMKLTVEDLRKFPPRQVAELPMVCQSGANLGQLENIKGVLLKDILDQAGIVSRSHNDVKKMAIIATASDDYKVVFSWSEVFNSPVGEEAIVFFERDAMPLGDDEGRIALVSAKDIRTGPRHVKWLKAIEVRKIVD